MCFYVLLYHAKPFTTRITKKKTDKELRFPENSQLWQKSSNLCRMSRSLLLLCYIVNTKHSFKEEIFMTSVKKHMAILMSACTVLSLAAPMQGRAEGAGITVTQISLPAGYDDITMEGEGNYEGYGSFILDDGQGWSAQDVLIDRYGNILFSSSRPEDSDLNYHYQVHGGIVSQGLGTYLYIGTVMDELIDREPAYYRLDGSRLFDRVTIPAGMTLIPAEPEDPDEADITEFMRNARIKRAQVMQVNPFALTYKSTPMAGGYAVAELVSGRGPVFIDQTGTVTHVLNRPDDIDPETGGCRNYAGWFGDNGWVACFADDLLLGYKDGSGQYMLRAGDFAPGGLSNAFPFKNGLSVVQALDGKWGVVDTSGNFVIPCMYDDMNSCSDASGIMAACLNGKWGYIDRSNQVVIPFDYKYTTFWGDGLGVVVLSRTDQNGNEYGYRYGMVDSSNNLIVPCEYDHLTGFVNGVAYGIKYSDTPGVPGEVYVLTRGAETGLLQ